MAVVIEQRTLRLSGNVDLVSDVYSAGGDRRPALLLRTPYFRRQSAAKIDALRLAETGWLVVVQSVRGRSDSSGEFKPFQELEDGAATIRWCQSLPECDGRVAMTGASYEGFTQWSALGANNSGLFGIYPQVSASDVNRHWFWSGGLIKHAFIQSWAFSLAFTDPYITQQKKNELRHWADDLSDLYLADPVHSPLREFVPFYSDWVDPCNREGPRRTKPISAAVYQLTGWYDLFLEGALADHQDAAFSGIQPSRLVIGPWAHDNLLNQVVGHVDHGLSANGHEHDLLFEGHEWLRQVASREPVAQGVSYFVMGGGGWREAATWPPATVNRTFATGDSLSALHVTPTLDLQERRGTTQSPLVLRGAPGRLPSTGGRMHDPLRPNPGSFRISRDILERPDTALLATDRLSVDTDVVGSGEIRFRAKGNAGGIFAFLAVERDDSWLGVMEGALYLSADTPEWRVLDLRLDPVAIRIPAGSRLGLLLTLSWFPAYSEYKQTVPYEDRRLLLDSNTNGAITLEVPVAAHAD